jgi:hypothetical protein
MVGERMMLVAKVGDTLDFFGDYTTISRVEVIYTFIDPRTGDEITRDFYELQQV